MISALNIPQIIRVASISLAVAVAAIILVYFLVSLVVFLKLFRRPKKKPSMDTKNPFFALMGDDIYDYIDFNKQKVAQFEQIPMEEVEVKTDDSLLLKGLFYPVKDSKKTIICMHGYNSSPKGDFAAITPFLHSQGFNLLFANHRAHGPSEGKYIGFGVLDHKDSLKWIELANELVDNEAVILYGISMGAATVMMASELDLPSNVVAVIEDCGYTSVLDVFNYQIQRLYSLKPFPVVNLVQLFAKIFAKYSFNKISPLCSLTRSSIPTLFIYGSKDSFVPTFMGEANFEACASPKSKLVIEGAGHAQSYFKNPELYEEKMIEFIEKCSDPNSSIIWGESDD